MANLIGVQQSFTDDQPNDRKHGVNAGKEVDRNSDEGKLFIGGLSWNTPVEELIEYMSKFGEIEAGEIKMDAVSNRSRGFGFIKFKDPSCADVVLNSGPHELDGRTIDPKKATKFGTPSAPAGAMRTKKIFVGGLKTETTEEKLKEYFDQHSQVHSIDFVIDPETKKKRGFCFVELDSEDVVDYLVKSQFHSVGGKTVEVKHAFSKEQQAQMGRGRGGRGGARGGGGGRGAAGGGMYGGRGAYGASPSPYGGAYGRGSYGAYGAYGQSPYGGAAGPYGASAYYGGAAAAAAYGLESPYAAAGYGSYGAYGAYGAGAGAAGAGDVRYPEMPAGRGAASYGPIPSYARSSYHPYSR